MAYEIMNVVKARPDRNDETKTHWDPLGIVFRDPESGRMWGQIYAIGEVCLFPKEERTGTPKTAQSQASGPFG